jgi:multidrug efflux pump subunit AcrB
LKPHRGVNEIFFWVISISITLAAVFLPVIFLEGLWDVCFWNLCRHRRGSTNFSFCPLTLTPMLNAYLMKGGEQKKSKFICIDRTLFPEIK